MRSQIIRKNNDNFKMASDSAHVGKSLELKSPMGVKSAIYKWPLQKGKGSVRRAENKEDEAAEILETIRYYYFFKEIFCRKTRLCILPFRST